MANMFRAVAVFGNIERLLPSGRSLRAGTHQKWQHMPTMRRKQRRSHFAGCNLRDGWFMKRYDSNDRHFTEPAESRPRLDPKASFRKSERSVRRARPTGNAREGRYSPQRKAPIAGYAAEYPVLSGKEST